MSEQELVKNDSEREELWQQILDVGEAMVQLAAGEDWDAVSEQATRQQQLLEAYFSMPVPERDYEQVAIDISTLLSWNEELLEVGKQARKKTIKNLTEMQKQKNIEKIYQENAE